MPRFEADAILFDMDGTLVDESASYREAVRLTAAYLLGEPVSAEEVAAVKRIPGFNNDWDATWSLVEWRLHGEIRPPGDGDRGSHRYRRLRDAFQTYYLGHQLWAEVSGSEPPFPWTEPLILRERSLVAPATLEWLGTRFVLGIATSRPRMEAFMALRQHALEPYFPESAVVAAEDAPYEKPHPAPLLELVRRLGCAQPVYVGDTVNDAIAASRAGMPFIHIGRESLAGDEIGPSVHTRLESVDELITVCAGSQPAAHSGKPDGR